ncbi:MAG: CPBP family intramembrane metalloprotease [Planctomycetes bacterium]|nr:CPBP family intramembrane metalloprotease [Planctomycetota bacterium]
MTGDSVGDEPSDNGIGDDGTRRAPEIWPRGTVLAPGEGIDAACGACGQPWLVHASMAGFQLRCVCGAWMQVGRAPERALPFSDEAQLPTRASRTVQLPAGPPPGELSRVRSWDGGPLRPDADGQWSLRHASASDREQWSNRTVLELALVMLCFIGPSLAIDLATKGTQRVLWMPIASLISSSFVLVVAGTWRGRALEGLRGASVKYFVEAVVGAIALGAVAVGYSYLWTKVFPHTTNEWPDARDVIGLPGLLFVISFCPGVFEEIAFRGLLNARLAVFFGVTASAWIGAAAFAFAHGITLGIPFHFGLGVWFTFLRRRSGSLVPGMIAHALYNAIIVCAMSQR